MNSTSKLKRMRPGWLLKLAVILPLFLTHAPGLSAQSIVVMVNDEPVTSYDVSQRQRFLALTGGGLSDQLRNRLKLSDTQDAFKAYMTQNRPGSREEAQALQKKFVAQLQSDIVASASKTKRKEAIDQLIEERLMVQAARDQKIDISDDEINQTLTRMAQVGPQKRTLEEFLASFKAQGINPATLKERIRAQTAWRSLIRRVYGSRVQQALPTTATTSTDDGGTVVDVEVVKLSAPSDGNQQAVARRLVEAEEIRKGFSSCAKLNAQLKGKAGVSVQSVKKADLKDFPGDVRAALIKAKPGDMTPPVIKGKTIEIHAVCSKKVIVPTKNNQKDADAGNKVQEEFQLYSRRHLKDLRDRALLKYPKSG